MAIRATKTLNPKDYELSQIQQWVADKLNEISSSQILDGTLLAGINLIAGQDNLVSHKLNRTPVFWILARQNTNTTVWEVATDLPQTFLNLRCGSNCTINLWVG